MARMKKLENMRYSELSALRTRIDDLMLEKQNSEMAGLREKMSELAKEHGLSIDELFGKDGRRKGNGSVPPKYRDPKNAANVWSGRGRMARWLVAATKGGKAKKEDFLI
jgi:DNA-binding protein H-NS